LFLILKRIIIIIFVKLLYLYHYIFDLKVVEFIQAVIVASAF